MREHEMTTCTAGQRYRVAPQRVRARAASTTPVRLTRRGRIVVLLALVTLLLLAFTLGRVGDSQASTSVPEQPSYGQTTVRPGETLWSVARRVAPAHDTRAVVSQLRTLNQLRDGAVQAGQQLLVPATS